jgi:hypothetical protein
MGRPAAAVDLSAIVLCYRAGSSIRRVIEPLHRQLDEAGVSYELVAAKR